MQSRVERELADSDVALLIINGEEGVGPGDRFLAALAARGRLPVVIAVNKIDRLNRSRTMIALRGRGRARRRRGRVPDLGADRQRRRRADRAPRRAAAGGAVLLPRGGHQRPAAARCTSPSSSASRCCGGRSRRCRTRSRSIVEEIEEPREDLTVIRALVWVETDSQKGILIGSGGRMIKAIGTAARRELAKELGTRVHLELSVRVRRGWRGDDAHAGPAGHRVARTPVHPLSAPPGRGRQQEGQARPAQG